MKEVYLFVLGRTFLAKSSDLIGLLEGWQAIHENRLGILVWQTAPSPPLCSISFTPFEFSGAYTHYTKEGYIRGLEAIAGVSSQPNFLSFADLSHVSGEIRGGALLDL